MDRDWRCIRAISDIGTSRERNDATSDIRPTVVFFPAAGLFIAIVVARQNTAEERDDLKAKLHDHDKWLAIAHKLGEFGIEGKALIPKPYTSVASWEDVYRWRDKVANYIEVNVEKGYRFLFESGAGNEPKVPEKIASDDDRERWIHIQARLMTLKKLVWKAVNTADTVRM